METNVVAGRYVLLRPLARGGMGEVFAAVDKSTETPIALKRMLPQHAAQRAHVVNFMREYHALSELKHPRIITVYDYGVDSSGPYYTMELLDGADLRELSPAPFRDACRYLRDTASSLALLHARRLLHRDLSPRNVRCTSEGRCKLLDFGAMMPFGIAPNLTGTPPCIAPEALQGRPLDQRADLYSLGALAYFVLTGRYAHPAKEIASLPQLWQQPITPLRELVPEVPEQLDKLVLSLLSIDPRQRPASAAEVLDRLSAVAGLEPEAELDDDTNARSFLSCSQLIGRSAQRAKLQKHIDRAAAGRGSALLLSGESGTGRSRMLAEAALLGQMNGLTVVCASARSTSGLAHDLVQGLVLAAGQQAQAASADRPLITQQAFAAQSGEERVLLLRQLSGFVKEIARARPLLVTVDDVDGADELSAAVAASLAHQSAECPLVVIASCDSSREPPMLARVPGLVETVSLHVLDRAQTHQLTASLFGDVQNLERVSDWLYRVGAGNPKLTLQLANHLLTNGVVRYAAGTWVLPSEVVEELPPSAAEALLLRLAPLRETSRTLAELLSVARSGASTERIFALLRQPPSTVFDAIDELVRAGVLENAGTEYVFGQAALRDSLRDSLPLKRQQKLHSIWAACLLEGTPDAAEQLEAGWHLTHTHEELRGADLLAKIAPDWVNRRVHMAVAVPSIERALEIYERYDRPLAQRLHLRSTLVMSSFLYDHKLAERHAEATLDALYPFTGLSRVERLTRWVGKRAAFFLGLVWTILWWLVRPPAARGPWVLSALKYYARSCMGLVGLRALALDGAGIRAGLHRMRAFEGSPHPTLRLLHMLAKAIALHNEGRGADILPLIQELLRRFGSRDHAPLQMNEAERIDILSGVLLLQGLNECYRLGSASLSYAERLEQLGTPLAVAAAMRIRLIYYLIRGEPTQAQYYRRQVDLAAINNGTVWQIEWIAIPSETLTGAINWADLIALRRALDALEKLMQEVPSFVDMRDSVRIHYHFRRGDYATTIRYGEQYMAEHAPFSMIGWSACYSYIALAYIEQGNYQRALQICEHAHSLPPEHYYEWAIHYAGMRAAYASALALVGERERSEQLFHQLLELYRQKGELARASLVHEHRVRVARLLGDHAAMHTALQELRAEALASGNPTAILIADSLTEQHARKRATLPAAVPEAETIVTTFLLSERALTQRAQRALQILSQYLGASEGYMYWVREGGLELAASLDRREPPSALQSILSAAPANDQRGCLTVSVDDGSYTVVRLYNDADSCIGVAALSDHAERHRDIPSTLVIDIGRALVAERS